MQLFPALPEVVRGMFRRPEALAVCPPGGGPRERGMFLNQTANYGLSQWETSDRILMENFNSDNSKIDAALKEHDDELSAKGNCQIWTTSYVGSGNYGEDNPSTLAFPFAPAMVLIVGHFSAAVTTGGATSLISFQSSDTVSCNTSWSQDGTQLTWYNTQHEDDQMNSSDWTYWVVAVGEA